MKMVNLNNELDVYHNILVNHSLYTKIKNLNDLKVMMETHVFAVWDFMSLLKSLQRELTCVEIPWKPSKYPKKIVRMINEIVLGEESDWDFNGEPMDHFSLYLKAMTEIGANTNIINEFILTENYNLLSPMQAEFVKFNLDLASKGKVHEVAAAFFYGREKVIPDMFRRLLDSLNIEFSLTSEFKNFHYYLKRHIELDGDEHSHLASECLEFLCGDSVVKWNEAREIGMKSLILRDKLWKEVQLKI